MGWDLKVRGWKPVEMTLLPLGKNHGRKGSLRDSVADKKGEMPADAHSLGGGGAVGKHPRAPLKGAHSMMG